MQGSVSTTVLLIDDQMIVVEAVRQMLSGAHDIDFHYCTDPTQAFEKIAQVKPTVLLQDLMMPQCDGLTLLRYLRGYPGTADLPIVVLSSKEEPTTKEEAFLLGANDYLVKLPDPIELIARLRYHSMSYRRLLERNEAYRQLAESQKELEGELSEAAAYVRSLLPPPLHERGIITDWRFLPSTQLGGDALGYGWIDSQHFVFYLLDVCGHGVGAALLSVSILNVIRSQSLPDVDFCEPAAVLQALNEAFPMEENHEMFFTIWYGVYDAAHFTLRYANGGHPPPVFKNAAGNTASLLESIGTVIGATPSPRFEQKEMNVGPGDELYLFSDGVYEVRNAQGEMLGIQRLAAWIGHDRGVQAVGGLLSKIQEWQASVRFVDDFSLLALQFSQKE